ncbi:MAG: carbonic anhydrase [Planctomycetaceae bacterium]|nr:carbonic anhydrase [Planctomycetaceae bacterium]
MYSSELLSLRKVVGALCSSDRHARLWTYVRPGIQPILAEDDASRTAKTKVDSGDAVAVTSSVAADEAIRLLQEGNSRFVRGASKHPHESKKWREKLAFGQKPFATVLGCSDSRVSPELIFDEGLGDLFVIRVAGNIVDEDVIASVEYAVEHFDTHLVVVLGHENCGAVTAALGKHHHKEPRELTRLVKRIHDNVCEHHQGEPDVDERSKVSTAVCKNTLCGVRQLKECTDLCECLKHHHVKVVAAIYDLKTGKVRWLKPTSD